MPFHKVKDNNDLLLRNVAIPLNKSTIKERKIVILSASITKPIQMKQFNLIRNGTAVKRAYGGTTTNRLKYYVKPDTIIINGGTNNFTKTNQTPDEISKDIFDIVQTCQHGGVNHIFVSSITCRPSY